MITAQLHNIARFPGAQPGALVRGSTQLSDIQETGVLSATEALLAEYGITTADHRSVIQVIRQCVDQGVKLFEFNMMKGYWIEKFSVA